MFTGLRPPCAARASPVLDLSLLKIKTFRIGTVVGGVCRMGLDATPFMLPLLFQVGLRHEPDAGGLVDLFLDPGRDAGARRLALDPALAGFRWTLVRGAVAPRR